MQSHKADCLVTASDLRGQVVDAIKVFRLSLKEELEAAKADAVSRSQEAL